LDVSSAADPWLMTTFGQVELNNIVLDGMLNVNLATEASGIFLSRDNCFRFIITNTQKELYLARHGSSSSQRQLMRCLSKTIPGSKGIPNGHSLYKARILTDSLRLRGQNINSL
jgi:hypothetical protein